MTDLSCLFSIQNKYQSLTKTEKVVADYIAANPDRVVFMSVDELSAASGAVKSAIIRCCKSLGFRGYSDLKIALASDLSKNKQLNYVPYIDPGDNEQQILDKVFAASVKTLHETAEKLNRQELSQCINWLDKAEKIYIYGIGTSGPIVNDFHYRLMQIGKNVSCFTDIPAMNVSTLSIKQGDVVFGISHSGRTTATIQALTLAKQMGAKTICLTSAPGSLITEYSDCKLEVYSDEIHYPVEAVSARMAHFGIIDTITVSLSSKNYENAVIRAKKIHELLEETIRRESSKL